MDTKSLKQLLFLSSLLSGLKAAFAGRLSPAFLTALFSALALFSLLSLPACSRGHGGGGSPAAPAAPSPQAPTGSGHKVSVAAPEGGVAPGQGGAPAVLKAALVKALPLSGQCPVDGASVLVDAGGGVSSSTTCKDGSWSLTLDLSSLADGTVTVSISVLDSAGKPSDSISLSLVKLTKAPSLSFDRPADNSFVNAQTVKGFILGGKCSLEGGGVSLTATSTTATTSAPSSAQCAGGTWQAALDLSGLDDGLLTVTASLLDQAGNSAQAALHLQKKVAQPTVTIAPLMGDGPGAVLVNLVNSVNVGAFVVGGSCSEEGNPVAVSGSLSAAAVCAGGRWSVKLGLTAVKDGAVSLSVDHSDNAGNFSAPLSLTLKKDTRLPTLVIVTPAAKDFVNNINSKTFAVLGACSEEGASVTLSGSARGSAPCLKGSFTASLDFSQVPDGLMLIQADLTSAAGNPAKQASVTLVKSTGGPLVSVTSPASGFLINAANVRSVSVVGTCSEEGATVSLHGAASALATCSLGAFRATLDFSGAPDGNVQLLVDQKDKAGNNSNAVILGLVKASTPPTVSIVSPSPGSYFNKSVATAAPLSGRCSAEGRQVALVVSGVLGASASSQAACHLGLWSATVDLTGVAEGAVSVTANLTDAFGNAATQASAGYQKKTTPPSVSINAPSGAANLQSASSVALSGTCSENGRLVSLSGDVTGRANCSGFVWSTQLNLSNLADATLRVAADLSDVAGNAAQTAQSTIVKLTTAPTLAFTSPAPQSPVNAAGASALLVTGSCSAEGQNVLLSGWGSSLRTVCTSGVFSGTLNVSPASDGVLTLRADGSDSAGNPAIQTTLSLIKKATLPVLALSAPANGSYVNAAASGSLVARGSCSDEGQSVTLTVTLPGASSSSSSSSSPSYSASSSCSSGAFLVPLDIHAFADGNLVISASTQDAAGNGSSLVSLQIIKLTTPPSISIDAPGANSFVNAASATALGLSGSCSAESRVVNISGGGASVRTVCTGGLWDKAIDISAAADGMVSVQVSTSDVAGNSSLANRNFQKNTVLPTVSITIPKGGDFINLANYQQFLVEGKCSFEQGAVTLKLRQPRTPPSQPESLLLPAVVVSCKDLGFTSRFDLTGVQDGAVELVASEVDSAGNTSSEGVVTLLKDTVAPSVQITAPVAGSFVNHDGQSRVLLYGTCSEEGQTVVIGGDAVASAPCGSGAFHLTLDLSSLPDAPLLLTADLTDLAGNKSQSARLSLVKDTLAPTITITSPTPSGFINLANASQVNVQGSCSNEGQLVVLSGAAAASSRCQSGAFSAQLDLSGTDDGLVLIVANSTSPAGNAAPAASVSLEKDTQAPTVTIDDPGRTVNAAAASHFAVSGTCSEDNRTVSLSFGGGGGGAVSLVSASCLGGAWTAALDLSASPDGQVVLTAQTADQAGNPSLNAVRSLAKKTSLPLVQILSPLSTDFINLSNYLSFIVSGSCSDEGGLVKLLAGGQSSTQVSCHAGNFSLRASLEQLPDGPLTLSVTHQDLVGNRSLVSAVTLEKDTISPSVTFAAVSPVNIQNQSRYTLSGSCSEEGALVSIGGPSSLSSLPLLTLCSAGAFSQVLDLSAAVDGSLQLTADLTDRAGNRATRAQVSLLKITTAPQVRFDPGATINLSSSLSYLLSGSCQSGLPVVIGGGLSVTLPCQSGSFSLRHDLSGLPDGPVLFSADQTDTAGNTATQAQLTVTKDTVPPTVAIDVPTKDSWANLSNQKTFRASGTCSEEGKNVLLTVAVSAIPSTPPSTTPTASPCAQGRWQSDLDLSGFLDGPLFFAADLVDQAGNPATRASVSFAKDTVAPTLTLDTPLFTPINRAGVSHFSLYGSCSEEGQKVHVSAGVLGDLLAETTCALGQWSVFADFSQLPDAPALQLSVSLLDQAQNPAFILASFLKDTTPPSVSIASPTAASFINIANASSFLVSGLCRENSGSVRLGGSLGSLGAAVVVPCQGGIFSASLDFSALPDGSVTITADLSDEALNAAPTASVTLLKSTVAPVVTIDPAASWINLSSLNHFELNGDCSVEGTLVYLTSAAAGAMSGAPATCAGGRYKFIGNFSAAADGAVTVNANLIDTAGNPAVPARLVLQKDTLAPSVSIAAPLPSSYANQSNYRHLTLSGLCSEEGQNVTVSGDVSASAGCGGGVWSTSVDLFSQPEGPLLIKADLSDQAANPALQASVSFVKDTQPPSLTLTAPLDKSYLSSLTSSAVSFLGTCSEANQSVSVAVSGVNLFSTNCSGGIWQKSGVDLSSQPDGALDVSLSQSDLAGNKTTLSIILYKKTTAVTLASLTLAGEAAGGYLNLAASTKGSALVALSGDGFDFTDFMIVPPAATCDSSRDFTSALSSAPKNTDLTTDGSYRVCVRLRDLAQNPPVYGLSPLITRDTQLPVINSLTLAGAAALGVINSQNMADSGGLAAFSGTSGKVSRFLVIPVSSSCDASQNFAAGQSTAPSAQSLLADGSFVVCLALSDAAANPVAYRSTPSFVRKTSLPTVSFTSPLAFSYINAAGQGAVALSGSCSEVGQLVSISGAASASFPCLAGGTFSTQGTPLDLSGLADGPISLTADLLDAYGNPAVSAFLPLTKLTVKPTLSFANYPAFINRANANGVLVTGACSANLPITLSGSVSYAGSCLGGGFSFTIPFATAPEGTVTLTASSSDAAGNQATQVSISMTKDTASPTLTINTPAPYINVANKGSYGISGSCSEFGSLVTVNVGGQLFSAPCSSSLGFSLVATTLASLPEGSVLITANLSDAAGNPATPASALVTKDAVAPSVTIDSYAPYVNFSNRSSYPVQGSCSESNQTLSLLVTPASGPVVSYPASCLSGAYAASLDLSSLAEGALTLQAVLVDLAGNSGSSGAAVVTKDTVAPTTLISGAPSGYTLAQTLGVTISSTDGATSYRLAVTGGSDCSAASYGPPVALSQGFGGAISQMGITSYGTYSLCVVGLDLAGNLQSPASVSTWVYGCSDGNPPAVRFKDFDQDGFTVASPVALCSSDATYTLATGSVIADGDDSTPVVSWNAVTRTLAESASASQASDNGSTFTYPGDWDLNGVSTNSFTGVAFIGNAYQWIDFIGKCNSIDAPLTCSSKVKLVADVVFNAANCGYQSFGTWTSQGNGTSLCVVTNENKLLAIGGSVYFTGSIDGSGFAVRNLYVNLSTSYYVGGIVGSGGYYNVGFIRDIGFKDGIVVGSISVGGVAGLLSGPVSGLQTASRVSGDYNVGGLVGVDNYTGGGAAMKFSWNSGTVSGTNYVGGLVGNGYVLISQSYNTGQVTGSQYVGGLVGQGASVTSSWNSGNVTGGNANIGGVMGGSYGGDLTLCYNGGNVTATGSGATSVGGIMGQYSQFNSTGSISSSYNFGNVSAPANSQRIGGIVGDFLSYGNFVAPSLKNLVNTGTVSGGSNVGGIAGGAGSTLFSFESTYSSGTVTGTAAGAVLGYDGITSLVASSPRNYYLSTSAAGGIGARNAFMQPLSLSASAMKAQASFGGFDFTSTWGIYEGTSYPYIKGFSYTTSPDCRLPVPGKACP